MAGYHRPCGDDAYIPSSWADHKNRNPPSSEPGTDYAVPVGTYVECAESGTVVDLKTSNSAATGRYVTVALDDGRTVRYLHLQSIFVALGYRVGRGSVLASSGASGNGSDYYYGAHCHTTLWPGPIWANPTIDFEVYAGEEEEPEMPLSDDDVQKVAGAVWGYSMSGSNGPDDENAVGTETGGERLRNIRRSSNGLKGRTERIDTNTKPGAVGDARTSVPTIVLIGIAITISAVALTVQVVVAVYNALPG